VLPPFRQNQAGGLEQHGHRRLVVGAENRVGRARDDSVRDDGLDRPGSGNRVEVRAEEDRRAALARRRRQPRQQIAGRVGGVRLDTQVAQIAANVIGDRLLLAGGARDRDELEKEREHVGGPGSGHEPDSRAGGC